MLDRLRRFGLRVLGPLARVLFTDRALRVTVLGSALICTSFALTAAVPLVMLLLGPIIWGIPHVLADVRYLVARPGLHRRPLALGALGVGIFSATGLGLGVRGGLLGAALALLVARGSAGRRAVGMGVVAGLFALAALAGPVVADVVFAHVHNLVAVLLWWAWRPREARKHLWPVVLFALGVGALLLGVMDPVFAWTRGLSAPWTGLGLRELAWGLAPGVRGPMAARLVVLYAFAQAVHYVVWLRLVPEDDRPSKTPRSYGQSFRVLGADIGGWLLWLAVIGAVGLAGWAVVAPGQARDGYLRLASFHGHLELAAGALLWAERRLGCQRA